MGPRELIAQPSASYFSVQNVVAVDTSGAYIKGKADVSATAEVKGFVSAATATYFILSKTGSKVTFTGGWTPARVAGETQFLSEATAGLASATEPSVAGQIRLPLGQALSTSTVDVLIGAGTTVGGTNLYTTIGLANNTTTTFHTIQGDAGTGGWLSGTIVIDATTDYVIPFFCFFDRQRDGTTYNVTAQFGDSIPTGLSITNSGSAVRVVMPNNAGFVSASVTYAVQAAANGTTLPVSVSASSVLGSTSGVAPAAGVIGESTSTRVGYEGVVELPTTTNFHTVVSRSLSAGVWLVIGGISITHSNVFSNETYMYAGFDTDESGDPANLISFNSAHQSFKRECMNALQPAIITASGATTVYLRAKSEVAPADNSKYACGYITAVRIG